MQLPVYCLQAPTLRLLQPMVDRKADTQVGARLKAAVDGSDQTVEQVAELCNVSVQAVYKWFRTGQIASRHWGTLMALLGLPPDFFFPQIDVTGRPVRKIEPTEARQPAKPVLTSDDPRVLRKLTPAQTELDLAMKAMLGSLNDTQAKTLAHMVYMFAGENAALQEEALQAQRGRK